MTVHGICQAHRLSFISGSFFVGVHVATCGHQSNQSHPSVKTPSRDTAPSGQGAWALGELELCPNRGRICKALITCFVTLNKLRTLHQV